MEGKIILTKHNTHVNVDDQTATFLVISRRLFSGQIIEKHFTHVSSKSMYPVVVIPALLIVTTNEQTE